MYKSMNHCIIISYLMIMVFTSGCNKEKTPEVSTSVVTNISETAATSGGDIIDFGGTPVTSSGVCWSTGSIPTIYDNRTVLGTKSGSFETIIAGLAKGKSYYVRAYAENSSGIGYGNIRTFTTIDNKLEASTEAASDISDNKARLNGKVFENTSVIEVTFEFGLTSNYGRKITPGVNSKSGTTTLNLYADLSDLLSGTSYHYRLVVEKSTGTFFGADMTFTTSLSDVDGNKYNTVVIGSQVWMQDNLRVTRYGNGDLISTTPVQSLDITYQSAPKYQWPCSVGTDGRYYTYYAITDSRNVCPAGWHVPTDDEWITLTDYLSGNGFGFNGNPNFIAKSMAATSGWIADTTAGNVGNDQPGNNRSGFTGLSSGGRYSNGIVHFVGQHGIWWSSTQSMESSAYFRCIGYLPGRVFKGVFDKSFGLPVRCLRND
jgi:uncharacterized protein (TIGR02145 family)